MTADQEKYRDKIATVDEKGKRIWIYPKKPKGPYFNARTYVSWVLLALLFGLPFIRWNGEPFVLFNVLERNFILFGIHFGPQDFHLFVLAMLTFLVFIVLFTVVYGRLFCGWVCPQTIFMEMVFRKIEYWIEGDYTAQKRLDKAPWTTDKIWKKASKHVLFILTSILIAHTFLSYVIGTEEVGKIITQSPASNLSGFTAMVFFTIVFYAVFSRLREQVCTTICPYGRLQGVMTDQNSILVSYDFIRGEPRGKINRKKIKPKPLVQDNPVAAIASMVDAAPTEVLKHLPITAERPIQINGDCIDCKLCIKVCPTGIDIRDGVQLECVNCTACIDACDEVMVKTGRSPGLIRYDSHNGIIQQKRQLFTPRVIGYTIVLAVLVLVNVVLLTGRSAVEAVILRTPGTLYQQVDETRLSNLYNFKIFNKTANEMPLELRLKNVDGGIKMIGSTLVAKPHDMAEGSFFIELKKSQLEGHKKEVIIEIIANQKVVDVVSTNFLGPVQ